ncbi:hypothetical protein [Bacillus inaquosorum]|uniref:hypothetical protein n=1 Tax=Bacillus inaquosorum TaxID=483913 RepID=UPI002282B551|nr:hypothetical protein [Bacillus inaquosorum]MCY7949364.1 hypothetical protein [Bacillus inaquosorum]MEC0520497.1 hypothetical protein [Bacillus inaquosorum]MEC0607300.1 hypothetical protein [Bacillus inaquosorum]
MNNTANENLIEIKEPKYNTNVPNHQLLIGQYIPPIDRLKIISPDEFEEMIKYWIYSYLIPRYGKVEKVVRIEAQETKGET